MAKEPEAAKTSPPEKAAGKAPEAAPAKAAGKAPEPAPTKATKEGAEKGAEGAAKKPRKPKRWLLPVASLVVVLLAGGGGAAWYFTRSVDDAEAEPAAKAQGKRAAVDAKAKGKAAKPKPGVFVPLEIFTVNLQADPSEQYLQTNLSLKVDDDAAAEAVKRQMPEIRDRILMLLSSKKSSDLGTTPGKQALAGEIASAVNQVLNSAAGKPAAPTKVAVAAQGAATRADAAAPVAVEGPVMSVFFTQFIIQ
jgi:flagellar protein FliL